jgi:copper resistance protein B
MRKPIILIAAGLILGAAPARAHGETPDMAHDMAHDMGSQSFTKVMLDRVEMRHTGGGDRLLWDAEGWHGGDRSKLRLKAEGETDLNGGRVEEAEFQALYSRAVTPFFDLNMGVRQDIRPNPDRTHLVLGLEGLAPYWFELDGNLFLSQKGDLTGRIEAEYELLFTQKLILQPRAEVAFSAQGVPELGLGSGITSLDLGLRLRYEIVREYAPYIGLSWQKRFGATADFSRAAGENPDALVALAGLRIWF